MIGVMQFRHFVFPHNPHTIEFFSGNRLVTHYSYVHGTIAQNIGNKCTEIHCTGEFFDESFNVVTAMKNDLRSAASAPGLLFVPGYSPPFWVDVLELNFISKGDGRVVEYSIIFMEVNRQ